MTGAVIRALDIVLALALLVFAAIPMLLIAAAIRLEDGGPALFRQPRVGRGNSIFRVLKFRTMRVDKDVVASGTSEPGAASLADANARFQRTVPGDPRITSIGRALRPSHLDELPQLLNILRGEMSFVGVRPDTPVQELDYTPEYWLLRHKYKPGLTGPAQLRTDPLTFEQRNAEEMRWIDGYSVANYLRTLAGTVRKVFSRSSF